MNTLEQQTFIDRLSNAEGALNELAGYADNLAVRLVGYADEGQDAASSGFPPSIGLLADVGDAAGRMGRKVDEIRRSLNRINQALPVETNSTAANLGFVGGQIGAKSGIR